MKLIELFNSIESELNKYDLTLDDNLELYEIKWVDTYDNSIIKHNTYYRLDEIINLVSMDEILTVKSRRITDTNIVYIIISLKW